MSVIFYLRTSTGFLYFRPRHLLAAFPAALRCWYKTTSRVVDGRPWGRSPLRTAESRSKNACLKNAFSKNTFLENAFFENFANFWRARSRLYQNGILQENMRSTAFFKLYKICILLHRCNLKIFAKICLKNCEFRNISENFRKSWQILLFFLKKM